MPKNISFVQWEANNLPAGLSFDNYSGTFSGTTNSEPGEYNIPVSVSTNYGTDKKDVNIEIIGPSYPIFTIGNMAEQWSEAAEPDQYGFRKLNIPNAHQLIDLDGVGARTKNGLYVAGLYDIDLSNPKEPVHLSFDSPQHLNSVKDINTGSRIFSSGSSSDVTPFVAHILFDGSAFVKFGIRTQQSVVNNQLYVNTFNGKILPLPSDTRRFRTASGGSTLSWFTNDPQKIKFLFVKNSFPSENDLGKISYLNINEGTFKSLTGYHDGTNSGDPFCYVTSNGKSNLNTFYFNNDTFGFVKNYWGFFNKHFILKDNNNLFAFGRSSNGELGLPVGSYFSKDVSGNAAIFIGSFDVKKIACSEHVSFMLLNDGRLFYSGFEKNIHACQNQVDSFSHIFTQYLFHDISYSSSFATLVATLKEVL